MYANNEILSNTVDRAIRENISLLSYVENYYLDIKNLNITNDILEKSLIQFNNSVTKYIIRTIDLRNNKLHKYNLHHIVSTFPNVSQILISDSDCIDVHNTPNQIDIEIS